MDVVFSSRVGHVFRSACFLLRTVGKNVAITLITPKTIQITRVPVFQQPCLCATFQQPEISHLSTYRLYIVYWCIQLQPSVSYLTLNPRTYLSVFNKCVPPQLLTRSLAHGVKSFRARTKGCPLAPYLCWVETVIALPGEIFSEGIQGSAFRQFAHYIKPTRGHGALSTLTLLQLC